MTRRRLIWRAILIASILGANAAAARFAASWDAGAHLLGGGVAAAAGIVAIVASVALRLAAYLVAPTLLVVEAARAATAFAEARAQRRHERSTSPTRT